MRLRFVGCLFAAVSGCTTAVPQVPICAISPDPVQVGDAYTVQLTQASQGTSVVLRLSSSDGTVAKKTLVIDNTGSAKYLAIARATGTTVVEIVEKDTATAPVLTTCMLHIADRTGCGDGTCGAGETCSTCSDDCGSCDASCGDGFCTPGETCTSCAEDCGGCTAACGDGTCNASESCQNCPADCGTCAATCGNGTCDASEACATCSQDCVCAPSCGDGTCNGTETCSTCAKDCGTCPATCGNGKCDPTETCTTCPAECGTCAPACGDAVCNGTETCTSCPKDCGACAPKCGDLLCNNQETCSSCAGDCGACSAACDPPSTSLPNGKHKPGTACMSCHTPGSKAGQFTVSGTAYTTIAGAAAVSGATITVTDANSKVVKLITASNGNFYSSDTSLKGPFKVVASKCPGTKQMNGDVTGAGGDCNGCHKSSNRISIQ